MRAPMVPAPRMATLLIRIIYWSGSLSREFALRKFIYGPVVFASPGHDDASTVWMSSLSWIRFQREDSNRKYVSAGFQLTAVTNFQCCLGAARKEFSQGWF